MDAEQSDYEVDEHLLRVLIPTAVRFFGAPRLRMTPLPSLVFGIKS